MRFWWGLPLCGIICASAVQAGQDEVQEQRPRSRSGLGTLVPLLPMPGGRSDAGNGPPSPDSYRSRTGETFVPPARPDPPKKAVRIEDPPLPHQHAPQRNEEHTPLVPGRRRTCPFCCKVIGCGAGGCLALLIAVFSAMACENCCPH